METKHYKKGEVIFREYTFGSTMYEIKSGSVGIYASYGKEAERKLTELGAGRIFGEMSMFEAYPRSATAVALEDVEALEVSSADIQEYFANQPEKLLAIMRSISRRLRELTDDYDEACSALDEWKDSTKRGGKKRSGLMEALAKYAKAYFETLQYTNLHVSPGVGNYYYY